MTKDSTSKNDTSESSTTIVNSTPPSSIIPITANQHIPIKLTAANYTSWRANFMAILNGYNLVKHITSNAPTQNSGTEYTHWFQQDQLILAAIFGSVSSDILPLVNNATTASSAWTILARAFASKSRSRIAQLRTELSRANIGSKTATEFMHFLKSKADELSLIDRPVTDDELTLYVINGLGNAYKDIAGPILSRDTPLRFEELLDKVFEHELYLKNLEEMNTNLLATANNAQSTHTNGSHGHQSFPKSGTSQSTRGGYQQNRGGRGGRGGRGRGRHNNQGNRPPVVCQICDYPGHTAPNCRRLNASAHVAHSPTQPQNSWLVDSGASHNLTGDLENLSIHSEYDGTDEIQIADGSGLPITHTGISTLPFPSRNFILSNVLCVPAAKKNLLYVHQFTKTNNVSMEFFPNYFIVKDQFTGVPLAQGTCKDGVYHIRTPSYYLKSPSKFAALGVRTSKINWHARLGHPSLKTSFDIIRTFNLPVSNKSAVLDKDCSSCRVCKSHRLPFNESSFIASQPLHYIYADVWGPTQVNSIDGSRYYLLLVDLFSCYCWLFPLQAKSQVSNIFRQFRSLVEKQFNHHIKNFFTDNGGEFVALRSYLVSNGINWLTTAPHTPQQNGIVERRNRHILDVTRALLHHSRLPLKFWSFAAQTAIYLINRMPTSILQGKSPFAVLFQRSPNYLKL